VVLALTGPGAAVADWVRDAIEGNDGSTRPLTSLPANGRLLVQSGQGPWIVSEDGSKRRLGPYREATWSPHGLFVAATRPNELLALDTKGAVRWSLARNGGVQRPRWSPDGFHIAYLSGKELRVVAGDGTGDMRIGPAARVAAAWRPSSKLPELAYSEPGGAIRVIDGSSGLALQRFGSGGVPTQLEWSSDGRSLLALSPAGVRVFTGARYRAKYSLPAGMEAQAAAFAPSGRTIALISRNRAGSRTRLSLLRTRGARITEERALLSTAGRFDGLAWSPSGDWLLASWPTANQWLFIRVPNASGPAGKVVTVSDVAGQFDPAGTGAPASPVPGGWCCPR
jgi:Tol biopolymer transport system component